MTLKVIGAGLGRTGTLSLKLALERLGSGPCHHMVEVLANPECGRTWVQAAEGSTDWDALFEGYASTVDYPGCTFWRELVGAYPAAHVILTVRDPVEWFESTQKTIFSEQNLRFILASPMAEFFRQTVLKDFGDRIHDREFVIGAFHRHNAEVRQTVPASRLLVYEVAQGWPPLCDFLGLPVPQEPFPRVNSREDFGARLQHEHANGPGTVLTEADIAKGARAALAALRGTG